jgi:DNA-binding CsgD family transcriptional regulator
MEYILSCAGETVTINVQHPSEIQDHIENANFKGSSEVKIFKECGIARLSRWELELNDDVVTTNVPTNITPEPFELFEQMNMSSSTKKPSRANRRWAVPETECAVRMRSEGKSNAEIGEVLGRTADAVQKHLEKHGAFIKKKVGRNRSNKWWTPGENKKLIGLYSNGFSNEHISRELNRSIDGVRNQVNRLKSEGKLSDESRSIMLRMNQNQGLF